MQKKIIIIGSGISGLACGYKLSKLGFDVTIFERSEGIGGLAGSYRSGDFCFDFGPHEFCTTNPELIEFLHEVLGDNLIELEKTAAQFYNNRFIPYPFTLLDIFKSFKVTFLMKVTFEVIFSRLKNIILSTSDYSFEKWVSNRYGKTLYNDYFGPYTKKVWGVDPNLLDARTASDRISFNSIFDYLIKAFQYFQLKKDDFTTIHSPLKKGFYYSKRGIGTLTEDMFKKCKEIGIKFHFNHTLKTVDVNGHKVTKLYFENGFQEDKFDHCISTIPLTNFLKISGLNTSNLPIRFRSIVFVFLEIPKERVADFHWIYYPDKEIIFQRLTNFTLFGETMTPKGSSGICAEISCFKGDDLWNMSDNQINDRVRKDLAKVAIISESLDCNFHVLKKEFGYPLQVAGYLEMVETLLGDLTGIKNLSTIGRQGLYKYCNMNECIEMAFSLGEQIKQGSNNYIEFIKPKWKGAGLDSDHH